MLGIKIEHHTGTGSYKEEEREEKVTYIVCGYDREEKEETIKDKKNNGKVQKKNDKRG